jgi:hypothetical protein
VTVSLTMSAINTSTTKIPCRNIIGGKYCPFGDNCKFSHAKPIVAAEIDVNDYDFDEEGSMDKLYRIKTRLPTLLSSKLTDNELQEFGDIYATVCELLSSVPEVAELARDIYSTFKMYEWQTVSESQAAAT